MEPTHAKPVRRRRRWLIVAFVLVLVSLVSWWNWPRGDVRFVGKWEVLGVRSNGIPISDGEVLYHRRNGRTTQWFNGIEQPRQFHWWVEGDDFVIEPNWPTGFAELREIWRGIYGRLSGMPVTRQQIRFPIAECSEAEVSFHSPDGPSRSETRILLRRLPE